MIDQTSSGLRTRLTELTGVDHPIVQTGMGWVSGATLTSATADAGGLGILAAATMTLDELKQAIAKVKSRTTNPFGVNLRADQPDLPARLDLIISEDVRVASFATPPAPAVVVQLRNAGVVVIPTVGARRHAEKMEGIGVDAVIAQGAEGGGHTGDVPTSLLIPDVVDAVDIPVIAAGGFRDGRGLLAALSWGAEAVAMGTRFLLTKESTVPDNVKEIYLGASGKDTVRTVAIDGHPQRVIRTEVIDELESASMLTRLPRAVSNALKFRSLTGTPMRELLQEGLAMRKSQDLTWPQLAMAANAPMLTKAAMVDGHPEVGILPTGQIVGEIDSLPPVAVVIEQIMGEATATLSRLKDLCAVIEPDL